MNSTLPGIDPAASALTDEPKSGRPISVDDTIDEIGRRAPDQARRAEEAAKLRRQTE
jgi:hypothetical protein